jgi:hypothetical protein
MIARVNAAVTAGVASRRALSLQVCAWMDWRSPNGRLKEVSCRKVLGALHRHGLIALPPADSSRFRRCRSRPSEEAAPPPPEVSCTLEELGEIRIIPVMSRYSRASRTWNMLMARHHYLGKGPLCGAQIRYVVESERYGVVGALAFSAAQWRMKARDMHIGWSEAARRANLHRVVCNSRFLIVPTVRVRNLASYALSRVMAQLGDDWAARYGYRPVLVESFVDPRRYAGTSYRAANWEKVGQTKARATPYSNGKVADGRKDIYVYPLGTRWREVLCTEPEVALCGTARPTTRGDWIEEEFGTVRFPDERLRRRLYTVAGDFFEQPGELIPQASKGSAARTKAAYRFFSNPTVDMQTLLVPHIEATIGRMRGHGVILAVQDTSTLNYTAHAPEGTGPISRSPGKAVGLVLHDTMAITPEGVPLGLLNVQCWARDPKDVGKKARRHQLPIEEKESKKWLVSYRAAKEAQRLCPGTMVVSVGDREADIYELFEEARGEQTRVLVRAERTRWRKVEQTELWERMRGEPIAGEMAVRVPRRGSRAAREARIEVRHAKVKLTPPKARDSAPVEVWAVYGREVGQGAQVSEPIDWMLLTTVETESFEAACERLGWYSRRWGIEVYHRTMKSGCRIEDRRLDDAESLQACLAIDLVVGWRVYWLTMVGRERPEMGSDHLLSDDEWRVLSAWATGTMATTPPGAQDAMRWVGKLGGWLARGRDDNPGTTCMWRGLVRLPSMVEGYVLALQIHGIRAGP